MQPQRRVSRRLPLVLGLALALAPSCRSPRAHREAADRDAYRVIARGQEALFGQTDPFTVTTPEALLRERLMLEQSLPSAFPGSTGIHALDRLEILPDDGYFAAAAAGATALPDRAIDGILVISLEEALQIAARNSPAYRREKERVFLAALDLDLEQDAFRNSWEGVLSGELEADRRDGESHAWSDSGAVVTAGRLLRGGAEITTRLGLNLVQLIRGGSGSSMGLFGDASISVPLLRGAGRLTVSEPLTQAERNVIYALYSFEHFKAVFAVQVAADYLGVLERRDRVRNAEENYRGLTTSAQRARRLADMGRLPEIQVDQAVQDELRARERWIAARQALARAEDGLRQQLGLPVDARVEPDPAELDALARLIDTLLADADDDDTTPLPVPADDGGLPLDDPAPLLTAFEHRLDLRVAIDRLEDAQRRVAVGADALRADLRLVGGLSAGARRGPGSAGEPDARLLLDEGLYSANLTLRPPWNRRRERNQYRERWIALEQAVREAQQLEDRIKFDVRERRRVMREARESVRIQARALETARRRVRGTDLFLEQGRAQMRDLLEARESLVSAENALTAAVVRYRVAELEYNRDLGLLHVDAAGHWTIGNVGD